MSLISKHPHLTRVFDDLTRELMTFTSHRNPKSVKRLVNTSFDVPLKTLVKFTLTLRKFNNGMNKQYSRVILKLINKVFLSRNNLDDADSHPIGQDLSIFSCSNKAQATLNVKRLTNNGSNVEDGCGSNFIKYLTEELHFKNEFIEPTVNDSSTHSNPITWFRIKITKMKHETFLQTFKKFYVSSMVLCRFVHDIYLLSEEFGIVELYYKKCAKKNHILNELQVNDYVEKIIFCSELELLKRMKCRPCDLYSNMLKFYFCTKTKNIDFILTSQHDLHVFHYVHLICSNLFAPQTPAPITGTSCSKPMGKSVNNSRILEEITPYELKLRESRGDGSLTMTSATLETLAYNARHTLHVATQDRDRRILGNPSTIGGVNGVELVINSTDEVVNMRKRLLRKMSI
nr:P47 [Menippe mercenaria nudivirus]